MLKLIKGLEQPPAPENQGIVAVTCLLPVGDKLFGGDDIGRVVKSPFLFFLPLFLCVKLILD